VKLSREMLDFISKSADEIDYGSITIHITDTSRVIDIEVDSRIRFEKATIPRPGEIASGRRAIVRTSREDVQ
jgi:hypothetical protein